MSPWLLQMCLAVFNICDPHNDVDVMQANICLDYAAESCELFQHMENNQLQTGAIEHDQNRKINTNRNK
jgi:hypothetical protein